MSYKIKLQLTLGIETDANLKLPVYSFSLASSECIKMNLVREARGSEQEGL